MLDSKLLRNDLDSIVNRLAARGFNFPAAEYAALEAARKSSQTQSEQLQSERKKLSQAIGQAKAKGEDSAALMAEVAALDASQQQADAEYSRVQSQLDALLAGIPNLPDEQVPQGADENDNVEIRFHAQRTRRFNRHRIVF